MSLFKNQTRLAMAYTNEVGDKVYPVIVDIKKGIKSTEEIQFMSSDINTGILSVAFIQGNDNYNVSGAEVVCSVMRPDASTLELPCDIVRDNVVEVPLGINGTSQDGIYSFDFKVFKGGNKVVGTPIMNYSVSLSISNDMVVEEDDRLPVLTMLMTQLTDLKGEARETINQANAATVSSREATANAIAATNNANAVSERVSQETSEAISRVDNKVNEVETRFNALTSSQQQDAEVIDARTDFKGVVFDSLKERIDYTDKLLRDSTVSTVETDKDFTTVEATSNGYFEDVKLEGKTLVNLVIHNNLYFKRGISVVSIGTDLTSKINNNLDNRSSRCTYKVSVKPNTIYTIIHCNSNVDTFHSIVHSSNNIIVEPYATWVNNKTFETGATTDTVWIHLRVDDNNTDFTSIDQLQNHLLILEGDHTQQPPNGYIEGLKSVGQDVDEIEVSSVNGDGNLVEYMELNGVSVTNRADYTDNKYIRTNYITVEPNQTYYIKPSTNVLYERCVVYFYDSNKSYLGYKNGLTSEFTTVTNTKFIRLDMKKADDSANTQEDINNCDFVVSKCRVSEYIPYQADKKRLLYYNEETQTWEKPILREWDSIEKHTDGKYYYHQRSGEVAFDGSEDWGARNMDNENNTIGFGLYPGLPNYDINSLPPIICDRFACLNANALWAFDEEGTTHAGDYLHIRILKSKLSTQDAEGFKQWLQANNVTVVYQLAQEKVYECTNIDLITYANETNYIVESGAIVPKTILKVHNNISNVVRTLQQKVSLLENKFIEGLKQVLAGDMYSLAELLYPEDFTEETSENGIMLIPFE